MSRGAAQELEQALSGYFRRRHCVIVGSGTTALYCIFMALTERFQSDAEDGAGVQATGDPVRPAVLFPAITCETAVNAAIFAGLDPAFSDVCEEDYTMTAETVRGAAPGVSIVVPTHIFGHLTDVSAIAESVPSSVPLVEDAAQAYGGSLDDHKAGGMGHAAIISFGPGKIVDCGAGGAILTDDPGLAEACREIADEIPGDAGRAADCRSKVMAELIVAKRAHRASGDRPAYVEEQARILRDNRYGYLAPCPEETASRILASFTELDRIAVSRATLAARIDEVLTPVEWITLPRRKGRPALWRYSFRVSEERRQPMADALKKRGVEVSKLFPPCTEKFSVDGRAPGRSGRLADTLVNLQLPGVPAQQDRLLDSLREVIA